MPVKAIVRCAALQLLRLLSMRLGNRRQILQVLYILTWILPPYLDSAMQITTITPTGGQIAKSAMSPNPIKISELSGVLLMVKPPFVLLCLHYTGGNFVSVTFVDSHFIHRKSEALKSFA